MYVTTRSLRSPNNRAHPEDELRPHAKFKLHLQGIFVILSGIQSVTMTDATK